MTRPKQFVMKQEVSEGMPKTRVKGVDTGHVRSIIPVFIRFLKAIGYDNVTDVHIVMDHPAQRMVWGKEGRVS